MIFQSKKLMAALGIGIGLLLGMFLPWHDAAIATITNPYVIGCLITVVGFVASFFGGRWYGLHKDPKRLTEGERMVRIMTTALVVMAVMVVVLLVGMLAGVTTTAIVAILRHLSIGFIVNVVGIAVAVAVVVAGWKVGMQAGRVS